MNKIYYIMGKSASGKDSIYQALLEDSALSLKNLVLYTTRPMREGEEDGREYFFVDGKTLEQFEKQGKIIERRDYETVYGVWSYVTADDGQVDLDSHSYIGIGTLESFRQLKKYYGDQNVVPIYIEVEDGERLIRSIHREQKQEHPRYEELCRRFLADQQDFSEDKILAAGITVRFENKDREECLEAVRSLLLAE